MPSLFYSDFTLSLIHVDPSHVRFHRLRHTGLTLLLMILFCPHVIYMLSYMYVCSAVAKWGHWGGVGAAVLLYTHARSHVLLHAVLQTSLLPLTHPVPP